MAAAVEPGAVLGVFWVTCGTTVLDMAVLADPPGPMGEEGEASTGAI